MVWAEEVRVSSSLLTLYLTYEKVLFSATRPKKVRKYIRADQFFSIWAKHPAEFLAEPPEIALAYTDMPKSRDGLFHATPIHLSHPIARSPNTWQFSFKGELDGAYQEAALFIDWLPSSVCPKPIQLLFPEST
jgi:hypothetical protein